MIETRSLGRRYGRVVAVSDLDLRVEAGEIYGFLGPNGAGKTTTIRMLSCLLRPTSGLARVGGFDIVERAREARSILGLVPDTPPLYDYLTGREYVGFVASLYGVAARDRDARAADYLEAFDLTDRADDLCKSYSHGMRKKIHLAAILVTRPQVLLLDEPTSGLDPASTRRLKDLLGDVRDGGTAVFLSTHSLETAEAICDRIGILTDGRLRAEGTMAELRAGGAATLEEIFLRATEDAADVDG